MDSVWQFGLVILNQKSIIILITKRPAKGSGEQEEGEEWQKQTNNWATLESESSAVMEIDHGKIHSGEKPNNGTRKQTTGLPWKWRSHKNHFIVIHRFYSTDFTPAVEMFPVINQKDRCSSLVHTGPYWSTSAYDKVYLIHQ